MVERSADTGPPTRMRQALLAFNGLERRLANFWPWFGEGFTA